MKNVKIALALTAFLFTQNSCAPCAEQSPAQHLLESIQEITGVPGLSAAVSDHGQIIWTGSAGYMGVQSSRGIDLHTKFRIASVSKLFTAALVLKLADEGIVDLDEDIRTYLTDWPNHDSAEITLRQLAAHIAGLSHYTSGDHYDPSRRYETLIDSLSIYAHKPLLFQPGEAYGYSSYGYALMGAVVESASGQPFDVLMDERIIGPLALTDTYIERVDSIPENTTTLYSGGGVNPTKIGRNNQYHVRGATSILSTPSDLLKFAAAYSAGDIVSEGTRDMSWRAVHLNDGSNAGEERYDLGFGWRLGRDWDGRDVAHHAGVTPGARSILSLNRVNETAVALLSNASWTSRIETTAELLATAATEGAQLQHADCPVGDWNYHGIFVKDQDAPPDNTNAHGRLTISMAEGVCRGKLEPANAIAGWLDSRSAQRSSMDLTLVAMRDDRSTHVFAMATPWGAFPFQMSAAGDAISLQGDIAGRVISLQLTPLQ